MCGRFSLTTAPQWVAEQFGLAEVPDLGPRYNIAPTQDVAVVRSQSDGIGNRLDLVRWGLVPPGSGPAAGSAPLINARSETVMEKPVFRSAFLARRCLVPADGFFEWRDLGGRKQPIYFTAGDERPFAFAGLWERYIASDGYPLESCTILTTEPNALVRPVHDRMPVILPADAYDCWLNSANPQRDLVPLLVPFPGDAMRSRAVNPIVNSVATDSAECIAPHQYVEQGEFF